MKRLFCFILFSLTVAALSGQTESDMLLETRVTFGLSRLREDPLLQRTAVRFAAELKTRGVLSHRGEVDRTALQRYQAQGGTHTLVGEILGSGPRFSSVMEAWLQSEIHRQILLDTRWTHIGIGSADLEKVSIWVVLFTRQEISLRFEPEETGLLLLGRGEIPEMGHPILIAGLDDREVQSWSPGDKVFSFFIPRAAWSVYHRLGYRGPDGTVRISDAFYPQQVITSSPERESR